MLRIAKWKVQIIVICTLFSVAALSGCSEKLSDEIARRDFERLGGTELILEVDMVATLDQEIENLKDSVRQAFREQDRLRTEIIRVDENQVLIRLRGSSDMPKAMEIADSLNSDLKAAQSFSGDALTTTVIGEKQFRLTPTQDYLDHLKERLTDRAVDVLRKRIKYGDRRGLSVKSLENDQFRLLIPTSGEEDFVQQIFHKKGYLSFHMVREESNNAAAMNLAVTKGMVPPGAVYYPETNGGSGLIVERRTQITGECIKASSEGLHPAGNYPIVNFTFNVRCAQLFGRLTQKNIGKRFAVVLDDEIITAPRINAPIMGGSGFIEGSFSLESAKELARLLNSGPLPARFKIIKETTIKPKI